MAVEVEKAILIAMTNATEGSRASTQSSRQATVPERARSRIVELCLRQPVFNWAAKDKFQELKQFDVEVMNIFLTNSMTLVMQKGHQ